MCRGMNGCSHVVSLGFVSFRPCDTSVGTVLNDLPVPVSGTIAAGTALLPSGSRLCGGVFVLKP